MAPIPLPLHKSKELGGLLRTSRLSLGLTLTQVAEAVDITTEMYGRIERGGMMPNVAKLQQICLRLDLDYQSVVSRLGGGSVRD